MSQDLFRQSPTDDVSTISTIQETLNIGNVYHESGSYRNGRHNNPSVRWVTQSVDDAVYMVHFFERFPLCSRKRRDYEIWAQAVRFLATRRTRGGKDGKSPLTVIRNAKLRQYKQLLEASRKYLP